MSHISPLAIIEPGAKIGSNCTIEPFAFVSSVATLNDNCVIKQGARILGNTTIGANSVIYSYAIVGDIPQDISYKKEDAGGLIIGERAVIREFATINSGTQKGDGYTRIGDDAFIMAYCHIAHDCTLENNIILANNVTLAGHVNIGSHTVVGGLTPIHQFVSIGESCMIAGASALSQDIPPFCLAEGNRAVIRGLNVVGLRRRFDKDIIDEINRAYKFIFRHKEGVKKGAEELLKSGDGDYAKKMCEFILNTKRGIPFEKKIKGDN